MNTPQQRYFILLPNSPVMACSNPHTSYGAINDCDWWDTTSNRFYHEKFLASNLIETDQYGIQLSVRIHCLPNDSPFKGGIADSCDWISHLDMTSGIYDKCREWECVTSSLGADGVVKWTSEINSDHTGRYGFKSIFWNVSASNAVGFYRPGLAFIQNNPVNSTV